MKTIKIYWLRFKSETPKALRKLQLVLSALLVPLSGAVALVPEESEIHGIIVIALIVIPFMVTALQFATADPEIQKLS